MNIEQVLTHYIETALWSTNDESDESGGQPLNANYDRRDIHPDTIAKMRADVERFVTENTADLLRWDGPTTAAEQAGYDFWLTRNGYGCGFWECEWTDLPTNPGDRLDKACEAFGETDLYVGDDGMLHAG
jgi:hypothetical protein